MVALNLACERRRLSGSRLSLETTGNTAAFTGYSERHLQPYYAYQMLIILKNHRAVFEL